MSGLHATNLRELSRAYAVGALDRDSYRRQRHELLTRIVAGQLAVLPYQPPEPEQRTVFPYDDDEGDTTQEILAPLVASKPAVARHRAVPWLPIFGVLALGAAGAAYFLLHAATTAGPRAAVSVANTPATSDPLTTFLAANQWHSPQFEALGARWDELDQASRASLRSAAVMRRLTDKAFEQIQSENALITLGDAEEALSTQQQLLDLMDRLGVEDQRLRRARETWRAASADFARKRVTEAERKAASVAALATVATPAAEPAPPTLAAPPAAAASEVPTPAIVAAAPTNTATPQAATGQPPTGQLVAAPPAAPVAAAPAASKPAAAVKAARGSCKASLAKSRRPYCQDALAGSGKGPALVVLPAGQFEMGGDNPQEQPRHRVKFERPFAIGVFEVSAGEFAKFCTATATACPAQPWTDAALPVVNLSWAAANAYVQWLSSSSGANYRLPSEAEWEYAARAGSTSAYPFGEEILPTHARYSFKVTESTPLAANDRSINRNDFKLYHMLGNVREWVADAWRATYANASIDGSADSGGDGRYVVRGGSYADRAAALRSAARVPLEAKGDAYTGLRVVRMVE